MATEDEQYSEYFSTPSELLTIVDELAPIPESLAFSNAFFEYRSEDIEVQRQIGEGAQARIYEVLVNTAARVGGENPAYETCAAKVFIQGRYGQWPEHVSRLADYYGSFVCHFNGYCMKLNSQKIEERDCFCLLMKKYDCSLANVIEKEKKKDNYSGRPFKTGVALGMIVQIAVGMEVVHKENLLHRDLKCANIFVYKDAGDNMPWGAYIGDFDCGGNVHGTLFWTAPEILEARDKGLPPTSTPMADVYSFGMVCYEILTGDTEPLHKLARQMGYGNVRKAVYTKGLRPELPVDLHPKIKDLVVSCWNQDPLQRPSFTDIVTELKTILEPYPEFHNFLESIEKIQNVIPLAENPTLEECLSRLALRLEELRLKYPAELFGYQPGDVDFVLTGYRFLKSVKKLFLKFGYKPDIYHPTLPWSMWFEMITMVTKCVRLSAEFDNALPHIQETLEMAPLKKFILDTLLKVKEASNPCVEEGMTAIQMQSKMTSWSEKFAKLPPLLNRHFGCVRSNNYGEYEGDKDYPICDFCKDEKPSQLRVENAQIQTFYLFHPQHARSTSFFASLFGR